MAAKNHPWEFFPQYTEERLSTIAGALLDVYYETQKELSTSLDDNYTRGATTFGRQRNRLIQMCTSGEHPWLDLGHGAFDLVCKVGGVPFRFFADDPDNPAKPGFWKNAFASLFPVRDKDPAHLRFVLEKPMDQASEAEVHFIGFNAAMEEVFRWRYQGNVKVVRAVDDQLPKAVQLQPVLVQPRQSSDRKAPDAGTGSK
jgi:hypothetical protein